MDGAVDAGRGVVVRPLRRERDGDDWEEGHENAGGPGGGRADRDEHIHVRALVADRVEKAAVEPVAGDELDRGGEDEEHEVHGFLQASEPPPYPLTEADEE